MDILLVGAKSTFLEALVDKFHKEGDKVYALTGNRYAQYRIGKVFEQYNFPYESDIMHEIIESIAPNVIIFMGAYDLNYFVPSDKSLAASYATGVLNILEAANNTLKKVKVIYLSNHEVFSGNFADEITEDITPNASDIRGVSILNGEEAVRRYAGERIDSTVLRLDHLVVPPKVFTDITEICGEMCLDYLEKNRIYIPNKKNIHSLLSLPDAVQFTYTAVKSQTHKLDTYHISASWPISESEIAAAVSSELGGKGSDYYEIKDLDNDNDTDAASDSLNETSTAKRLVLSNKAFCEEFGVHIFHKSKAVAVLCAQAARKNRENLVGQRKNLSGVKKWMKEKFGGLFWALVPFLENLLLFIPFFMLNNRATDSQYFSKIDFYLLYVLLFAIMHGQQQATFSALLATAGYIFRQLYTRSGFDIAIDYNTYVWIAQLFILGLVVGHMKDKIKQQKEEEINETTYLREQIGDIAEINSSNLFIKNVLETQIINQENSFGKVYEITSSLDKYEPEEVLFYATEIVGKLINSKDVAIYSVANADYARLFSATSDTARSLGNSIKYKELEPVYADLSNDRVYINRTLDERYPIMAEGIRTGDKLELIIMVWGIPWDCMNQGQANMLRIAGYLIQNAVVRANRYMDALEQERYLGGTNILDNEAFDSLLNAFMSAESKGLTKASVLKIDCLPSQNQAAGDALGSKLRQTDFLGIHAGRLYALLSNTDEKDADFVINRFKEAGYNSTIIRGIEF